MAPIKRIPLPSEYTRAQSKQWTAVVGAAMVLWLAATRNLMMTLALVAVAAIIALARSGYRRRVSGPRLVSAVTENEGRYAVYGRSTVEMFVAAAPLRAEAPSQSKKDWEWSNIKEGGGTLVALLVSPNSFAVYSFRGSKVMEEWWGPEEWGSAVKVQRGRGRIGVRSLDALELVIDDEMAVSIVLDQDVDEVINKIHEFCG